MSELLLEILSEEIPARMQTGAKLQLQQKLEKYLLENNITYSKPESYVTPRRLVFIAQGLKQTEQPAVSDKRGPRFGAPEAAILAFAKSVGFAKEELEIRKTDKGEFYFATISPSQEDSIEELLAKIINQVINEFAWPKSMRWNDNKARWVRPLRNILCLYNKQIIPVACGGIKANNLTIGHRFLSDNQYHAVSSAAEYKDFLAQNKVILSEEERRSRIISSIELREEYFDQEDKTLTEVVNLCEYPTVVEGKIDRRFLRLPIEVLATSMRVHQRYLLLYKNQDFSELSDRFIIVADNAASDNIIKGNQKVLAARLSDAEFFYKKDKEISLEKRYNKLPNITFHSRLGNMYDKTLRLEALVAEFDDSARRAAHLSKCDLLSLMVSEFPELQGKMGYYYALNDGESEEVALAIAEQYKPSGAEDNVPTSQAGTALALMDKIDSLVGLFLAGERPTGSKDPFAMRRSALGIIRIILEKEIDIDLNKLIRKSAELYKLSANDEILQEIEIFILERFRQYSRERGIKLEYINAITSKKGSLCSLYNKLLELQEYFSCGDNYEVIIQLFKRVYSIIGEGDLDNGEVDPYIFTNEEEKNLYNKLTELQQDNKLQALYELSPVVNEFFDKVIINSDEEKIRHNRKMMLNKILSIYYEIGDFTKLI